MVCEYAREHPLQKQHSAGPKGDLKCLRAPGVQEHSLGYRCTCPLLVRRWHLPELEIDCRLTINLASSGFKAAVQRFALFCSLFSGAPLCSVPR